MEKIYGNSIIKSLEKGLTNKAIKADIQPEATTLLDKQNGLIPKFIAQQNLIVKLFKMLMR